MDTPPSQHKNWEYPCKNALCRHTDTHTRTCSNVIYYSRGTFGFSLAFGKLASHFLGFRNVCSIPTHVKQSHVRLSPRALNGFWGNRIQICCHNIYRLECIMLDFFRRGTCKAQCHRHWLSNTLTLWFNSSTRKQRASPEHYHNNPMVYKLHFMCLSENLIKPSLWSYSVISGDNRF